jgi:hypothetical protein
MDGATASDVAALNWDPDWTEAPQPAFRRRVAAALSSAGWVVDGNYSRVRDLVSGSADTLVWLDYPFFTVFTRSLRRTLRRAFTKEPLSKGNRETFRRRRQAEDWLRCASATR